MHCLLGTVYYVWYSYYCIVRNVQSNMKSAGRECVEQTTALGGTISNPGCGESLLGICEDNYRAAGSFRSESTSADNLREDKD